MTTTALRGVLLRTLTLTLAAAGLAGAPRADDGGGAILEFQTMAPIQGALVGKRLDVLHRQAAGGLPWTIDRAHGVLHADGKLELQVRGLVLADDPAVPAARRLTNPIPTFRAVVSCVTADGTTTTSQTPAVSASSDGDARFEAVLDPPLPHPCVAPIVFVGNGAGTQQNVAWFAATGAK